MSILAKLIFMNIISIDLNIKEFFIFCGKRNKHGIPMVELKVFGENVSGDRDCQRSSMSSGYELIKNKFWFSVTITVSRETENKKNPKG